MSTVTLPNIGTAAPKLQLVLRQQNESYAQLVWRRFRKSKPAIVGGLMVTFEWSDWRDRWFWWIQSVYILPEARGRKIYSRLYDFVKEKGREAGDVCGFRLYVEKENTHAQKVYEKVGMTRSHYLMYEEMR